MGVDLQKEVFAESWIARLLFAGEGTSAPLEAFFCFFSSFNVRFVCRLNALISLETCFLEFSSDSGEK